MKSISWIISLAVPMLLHMILSEVSVILLGSSGSVTLCTTVSAVLTIPIAAWLFWKDRRSMQADTDAADREQKHIWKKILFGVFCFLAGGILNIVWSSVLTLLRISEIFSNATQEALLASELTLQTVGLGLLVPLAEELIFRGLIYNRMKQLLSVPLSVFFSALLFAVYHGNPIQMIFAFPMALALAVVYERGKSFVFPVLFHIGANLIAILVNLI